MIPLHRPWFDDQEELAVRDVIRRGQLAGNGTEGRALETELAARLDAPNVLAVSSASHALEIAIHLAEVQGGEVIVPSFTFPSVGNAIVRAGGAIRFCEVREPDLNVDLDHARSLITPETRALVVTHYAGHPLDWTPLPVPVVEDAAHALGSSVGGRACGTIAGFGCLSFHQTKNLVAGEGGALIVQDDRLASAARVFREKGTNRDDFLAGRTDFYSWVALGSSLVLPEVSAAIARVQLRKLDGILKERQRVVRCYEDGLADAERRGSLRVVRPVDRDGHDAVTSHHGKRCPE